MIFFRTFIARFRGSEFAKNTATLTLGTMAAQGIAIAAMPVLSRLYTPADFGLLAVFLAVSGIVATVITLRYETAILLPKDEQESKTLVLLTSVMAIFFGTFIGFVAWLLPDTVKTVLGVSVLNEWLVMSVLCGVGTALVTTGSNWYNRQRAYFRISTLRITQSVVCALIGIMLGLWGFTDGLMLGQTVASLIVAVMVLVGLRSFRVNWPDHDFHVVAEKHSAAPRYLLPAALLDVITLQLPVLLITAWFGSGAAGQFSMAWKILGIPLALIGAAVGQVFLRQFSETWPDAQASRKLLFHTWKALALIGMLPILVVVLFGEQLFGCVLGEAWRGAGAVAMVIAPMLFAMLVSSPTSGTFLVLGMQKHSLFFGIASLIYRPACIWMGFVNNDMTLGLILLTMTEITQIVLYQFLAIRKIKIKIC